MVSLLGLLAVTLFICHFTSRLYAASVDWVYVNNGRDPAITFNQLCLRAAIPGTGSAYNSCINNLRQIDGAKQQWALDNKVGPAAVPTWKDITPYMGRRRPDDNLPRCPFGGLYTVGAVSNIPTCTVKGHQLN